MKLILTFPKMYVSDYNMQFNLCSDLFIISHLFSCSIRRHLIWVQDGIMECVVLWKKDALKVFHVNQRKL